MFSKAFDATNIYHGRVNGKMCERRTVMNRTFPYLARLADARATLATKSCGMTIGLVAIFAVGVWICGTFGGGMAAAQESPRERDAVLTMLDGRVGQFLDGVSLGQTQNAFQELLADSQLAKQADAVKELVARTNELEAKYGKYRAFEQVSAKRIGRDLVLMRYLYKCENLPVVWYFTFYHVPGPADPAAKNGGAWRVVTVRYDTNLEALWQ
jgi:hypothetical protein